jgi:hypothetical protein
LYQPGTGLIDVRVNGALVDQVTPAFAELVAAKLSEAVEEADE